MSPKTDRPVIWWLPWGTGAYPEVWELQKALVTARARRELPDLVITVEHPHVITMGRSTQPENLLGVTAPDGSGSVPVVTIERGGDVTYHGPGQVVAYLIFDLDERGRDLHRFLRDTEAVQIALLDRFGLKASRRKGSTGVWIGDRKVGSVGIAVRRWITYHGFALNVATDLRFFKLLHPCGFNADVMTSMSALLGKPLSVGTVLSCFREVVASVFDRPVVRVNRKRLPPQVAEMVAHRAPGPGPG
jgi:lipoate-protein ligase B